MNPKGLVLYSAWGPWVVAAHGVVQSGGTSRWEDAQGGHMQVGVSPKW